MDYEKAEKYICVGIIILLFIGFLRIKTLYTPEAIYEVDRYWQDNQEMKTFINDYCFDNSTTNAELRYCKRQLKYKVKRVRGDGLCG